MIARLTCRLFGHRWADFEERGTTWFWTCSRCGAGRAQYNRRAVLKAWKAVRGD